MRWEDSNSVKEILSNYKKENILRALKKITKILLLPVFVLIGIFKLVGVIIDDFKYNVPFSSRLSDNEVRDKALLEMVNLLDSELFYSNEIFIAIDVSKQYIDYSNCFSIISLFEELDGPEGKYRRLYRSRKGLKFSHEDLKYFYVEIENYYNKFTNISVSKDSEKIFEGNEGRDVEIMKVKRDFSIK